MLLLQLPMRRRLSIILIYYTKFSKKKKEKKSTYQQIKVNFIRKGRLIMRRGHVKIHHIACQRIEI